MVKRVIRQTQPKMMGIWWVRALFGLTFLSLSYGFVSWAIDSGNLLHWALGLFFLGWAANDLIQSVRLALDR